MTEPCRPGVAGASTRRVAAEAQVSAGLVQRYFRTKDQLLKFAFDRCYERTVERLRERPAQESVRERLISGLGALVPFDEARLDDALA